MDIKLPHQLLKDYLQTTSTPRDIAKALSLCGPTVDRLHQTDVDSVYDIEVITNRVDSVSAFGVAREASAILPQFELPSQLTNDPYAKKVSDLGKLPSNQPINFQVLNASLLPRLTCIALKNVAVKDSPSKIQNILTSSGLRPLNNIIDISNELTLRFGLPVHIFDLDKIEGKKMVLRESKKGEQLTTLDGKTHTLAGGDIVIADASGRLIDLCGIMGGALSDVDENTKNVLLFVPVYEPRHIRKTSLQVQNRSLAAQIYEKSPDPELTLGVLIAGVELLQERANAVVDSQIFDYYPESYEPKILDLTQNQINQIVGIDIAPHIIETILKNLGFKVNTQKNTYHVTVPSWRKHDIDIWQDLVEEIARVYGYFRLPKSLPQSKTVNTDTAPLLNWETVAKTHLTTLGFTEVLTQSLVSGADIIASNFKTNTNIKLQNPLSTDYEYLRTSLVPNLLKTVSANPLLPQIKAYELSNVYLPDKKLPDEISTLTMAFKGYDFRTSKGHLEVLFDRLNLEAEFEPLEKEVTPFVKNQTAQIIVDKKIIGYFGVIDPQVALNFSIKDQILMVDINFADLSLSASLVQTAVKIPPYASVYEDITLESNQLIGDLIKQIKKTSPLIIEVDYISSLENKHTFHLTFNHPKRSLTQKEVDTIKQKLLT